MRFGMLMTALLQFSTLGFADADRVEIQPAEAQQLASALAGKTLVCHATGHGGDTGGLVPDFTVAADAATHQVSGILCWGGSEMTLTFALRRITMECGDDGSATLALPNFRGQLATHACVRGIDGAIDWSRTTALKGTQDIGYGNGYPYSAYPAGVMCCAQD